MVLKAVFLDLDDTLVATSAHDARAFAHAAALAERRCAVALDLDRLVGDVREQIRSAPWDPEYEVEVTAWRAAMWRRALENQGVADSADGAAKLGDELQAAYDTNRMGDFPFMPEVPATLGHLASRGLRTVVITNGHHRVQRNKLAACRAHELFPDPRQIIVGGEEVLAGRPEKPHPSIFRLACGVANCEPSEAIHVGDSLSADVQVRVGERWRRSFLRDDSSFTPHAPT
jgi:N-acylneuraminate-9-phosphatase